MTQQAVRGPLRLTDEQRLLWTAERVKVWRTYIEQPHVVAPGSVQAEDDKIFSLLPPSHLIWHGIMHAVDHLDMFINALVENGKAFPLAPQTLARSGVVGAAHALWMLDEPDRAERQRRALRMASEEFRQERTALREIKNIGGAESAGVQQVIDTRTEWVARAVATGASLGLTAKDFEQRLNDTDIIDAVAKRYVATTTGSAEHDLVTTYRMIWRTHSGTAHALRWPALHRTEILGRFAHGGASGRVSAGGLPALSMSASAMTLLIGRAIDLYEEQRQR
jgi:hypothetical protein